MLFVKVTADSDAVFRLVVVDQPFCLFRGSKFRPLIALCHADVALEAAGNDRSAGGGGPLVFIVAFIFLCGLAVHTLFRIHPLLIHKAGQRK